MLWGGKENKMCRIWSAGMGCVRDCACENGEGSIRGFGYVSKVVAWFLGFANQWSIFLKTLVMFILCLFESFFSFCCDIFSYFVFFSCLSLLLKGQIQLLPTKLSFPDIVSMLFSKLHEIIKPNFQFTFHSNCADTKIVPNKGFTFTGLKTSVFASWSYNKRLYTGFVYHSS